MFPSNLPFGVSKDVLVAIVERKLYKLMLHANKWRHYYYSTRLLELYLDIILEIYVDIILVLYLD